MLAPRTGKRGAGRRLFPEGAKMPKAMPVSVRDVPQLAQAIDRLYRCLEPANADRYAIQRAGMSILELLMPAGRHLMEYCPEIEESQLDSDRKNALLELRDQLNETRFDFDLSKDRSLRRRFREFLDSVTQRLNKAPQATTADLPERQPLSLPPRLTVDLAALSATLDGRRHDVRSEQALRWLKVLADNAGNWISAADCEKHDAELITPRVDRLRKQLPDELADLIDTSPGRGCRLNLA